MHCQGVLGFFSAYLFCTHSSSLDTYCPESVWILRVPHGDMTSHTIRVTQSRKDTKCQRHLLQLPLSLRRECGMFGDSGETGALRNQLQGGLFDLLGLLVNLRRRGHGDFGGNASKQDITAVLWKGRSFRQLLKAEIARATSQPVYTTRPSSSLRQPYLCNCRLSKRALPFTAVKYDYSASAGYQGSQREVVSAFL
jgi:hypothetical protein